MRKDFGKKTIITPLPVVIIGNDIFNQNFTARTIFSAVGNINAVTAGTFDGQVTDDDIVTAPETDTMPPLGVKIIRLFLVIFFAHFKQNFSFAAQRDIFHIPPGKHTSSFVAVASGECLDLHSIGKNKFQI